MLAKHLQCTPLHPLNKAWCNKIFKELYMRTDGIFKNAKVKIWAAGYIITKHNQSVSEVTRFKWRRICQMASVREIHALCCVILDSCKRCLKTAPIQRSEMNNPNQKHLFSKCPISLNSWLYNLLSIYTGAPKEHLHVRFFSLHNRPWRDLDTVSSMSSHTAS